MYLQCVSWHALLSFPKQTTSPGFPLPPWYRRCLRTSQEGFVSSGSTHSEKAVSVIGQEVSQHFGICPRLHGSFFIEALTTCSTNSKSTHYLNRVGDPWMKNICISNSHSMPTTTQVDQNIFTIRLHAAIKQTSTNIGETSGLQKPKQSCCCFLWRKLKKNPKLTVMSRNLILHSVWTTKKTRAIEK